jgi:alanine-synthesizing transaminase
VTFSARVPAHLVPNLLSTTLHSFKQQGRPYLDLTQSNPTRAGFNYPPDLLSPLGHRRGLDYAPEPLGLPTARAAVAADFVRRGLRVSPDRIALTASTSEAYSLVFKLLCDPHDEVLVPRPSYPLFEHLTRMDSVEAVPYLLERHGRWSLDLSSVERSLSSRARALLLVNPNNPTGSFVSESDLDALAGLCRSAGVAIIADEVFADYELTPGAAGQAGHLLTRTDVLGFTLGGLSKSVGLPQVKLGWMALSGDDNVVRDALERLALIADTYLSVSTPVQEGLSELLERGASLRCQIQARVRANHLALQTRAARTRSCRVLPADGGWYATLQVPTLVDEETLVLELLTEEGVLVHPGYFFDFSSESFLVVSLIPPQADFADAVDRVLRRFDRLERDP